MKYLKKNPNSLGIATSRNKCPKNKSYEWEMTVWTAYSSSAVLRLEKNLRTGDFTTSSTPKCFFLPNTNYLCYYTQTFFYILCAIYRLILYTTYRLFFDQGSGKLSLIHTEATRSFSENIPVCFTVRFCHNYFLKAVVWRQTFWWVTIRCPGTAVTPLSFLKWKLCSSRAPQARNPFEDHLTLRALLGRGPCMHRRL